MRIIKDILGEIMVEVRESRFRERLAKSYDPEEGRTKQQFRDEVNINTIMKRYRHSGIIPETRSEPGHYGDFSNIAGYDEAIEAVNNANAAFAELPSDVRTRFGNDPQELMNFMAEDGHEEEARELGILPPLKPEPDPNEEPVAPAIEGEGETPTGEG